MNLGTAASIGVELLQHRREIGTALNGLSTVGKGVGKLLAGEGFSKIAQKFHLSDQDLTDTLGVKSPPSAVQGLSDMNYYDADKNGEVTREELTQGLQALEQSQLNQTNAGARIKALGEQMLKNYDNLAQQDGNAGSVSYRDYARLTGMDNRIGTLSADDWRFLNS
jgi:hypothetical protein